MLEMKKTLKHLHYKVNSMDILPRGKSIKEVVELEKFEAKQFMVQFEGMDKELNGRGGLIAQLEMLRLRLDPSYNPSKKELMEDAQEYVDKTVNKLYGAMDQMKRAMNRTEKMQIRRASVLMEYYFENKWHLDLKPIQSYR